MTTINEKINNFKYEGKRFFTKRNQNEMNLQLKKKEFKTIVEEE